MRFQQIAFNHSSDIDFHDFMNLYKIYAENDNPLLSGINLLAWI